MKKLTVLLIAAALFAGCKSSGVLKPTALSSLNVTNAVIGGNTLTLNGNGLNVNNNGFSQYSLIAGQSKVILGDTSAHPQVVYYNQTIPTVNGGYYSLFLTGTSPSQVDNVLIKESYSNYKTNIAGIRFINLSPGSASISIDTVGAANGSEVSSLAYKGYTAFKQYPVSSASQTFNFEFRDAASGTLITTYQLTAPIFRNVTLCLAGLESNPTVIQDNDY